MQSTSGDWGKRGIGIIVLLCCWKIISQFFIQPHEPILVHKDPFITTSIHSMSTWVWHADCEHEYTPCLEKFAWTNLNSGILHCPQAGGYLILDTTVWRLSTMFSPIYRNPRQICMVCHRLSLWASILAKIYKAGGCSLDKRASVIIWPCQYPHPCHDGPPRKCYVQCTASFSGYFIWCPPEGNVKLFWSLMFGTIINWVFLLFFISPFNRGYTTQSSICAWSMFTAQNVNNLCCMGRSFESHCWRL